MSNLKANAKGNKVTTSQPTNASLILDAISLKGLNRKDLGIQLDIDGKELTKELKRLLHKGKIVMNGLLYEVAPKKPICIPAQSFVMPNLSIIDGKEVTLKVSQCDSDGNRNEFTQKFNVSTETFEIVLGSALNRLFEYQNTLVLANDRGRFKSTLPIGIEIETLNEFISTSDLSPISQSGLKLGNTAKRKRIFARKIYLLVQFITSQVTEISYSDLDASLQALDTE